MRPVPFLALAALATLAACAESPSEASAWPVASDDPLASELVDAPHAGPDVRPPPGVDLVLDATDVIPGQDTVLTVTSADPGETVRFLRGTQGTGQGPCPAALGGMCLELVSPVIMGSAVADANGIAEFTFGVPAGVPNGAEIWFEAVAARGQGGVDSVGSQVVNKVVGLVSPWRNSWVIDGDSSDWLFEESTETTSAGTWAVTWDDDTLYLGVSHPDIATGGALHWSMAYLGTTGPGTPNGLIHGTQQPLLPFDATHLIRRKADGSYDSLEVFDGQAWQSTSPFLGTAGTVVAEQGEVLEMAIPMSEIGNPQLIHLFATMVYEGAGYESTYAAAPASTFADGYDPDPATYFTFDLWSATPPMYQ